MPIFPTATRYSSFRSSDILGKRSTRLPASNRRMAHRVFHLPTGRLGDAATQKCYDRHIEKKIERESVACQ